MKEKSEHSAGGTMRDEFLDKIEGSDHYAQDAASTDLLQTTLSPREAKFWGPKD